MNVVPAQVSGVQSIALASPPQSHFDGRVHPTILAVAGLLGVKAQADSGQPTVVADPDGEIAGIYKAVARQVAVSIAARNKDFSGKFPSITISKTT